MRWGKRTLRWVEYQQGILPSPKKANQPDLEFSLQTWRIQGKGPGGAAPPPLIFGPTEAQRVKKKILLRPPPTPSYLKVWICQWSVWKNVRTPSLDMPLYLTFIILLNVMVV